MKIIRRILLALPFLVISSLMLGAASTPMAPTHRTDYIPVTWSVEPLVDEVTTQLNTAVNEKTARTTVDKMGKAGKAPTQTILSLKAQFDAVVVTSTDITNIKPLNSLKLFGESAFTGERNIEIEKFHTVVDQRVADIEVAVVAWETEVAAENARIKAAEEEAARQAAAKAAAERAAAASRSKGNKSGGTYTPVPGESFEARLARIYAGLAITKPSFRVGSCSIGLACYITGSGQMSITTALSGKSDCYLRMVIAHESRHYQQDINGQVQYTADRKDIANRDWLESDAYAYGYQFGC